MSKHDSNVSVGGGGFLTMLAVLFIGLKLGEVGVVAEWSWFWVLWPLWIVPAIIIGVLLLIGLWFLISAIIRQVTGL